MQFAPLFDACIDSENVHEDIAKLIYAMYKDRYRFMGRYWTIYNECDDKWRFDFDNRELQMKMSCEVAPLFYERSLYHTDLVNLDSAFVLNRIAWNLKTTTYKESVVKACRPLFMLPRRIKMILV